MQKEEVILAVYDDAELKSAEINLTLNILSTAEKGEALAFA